MEPRPTPRHHPADDAVRSVAGVGSLSRAQLTNQERASGLSGEDAACRTEPAPGSPRAVLAAGWRRAGASGGQGAVDLTGKPKTRARLSSASSPRGARRSAMAPVQADVRRQAVAASGAPLGTGGSACVGTGAAAELPGCAQEAGPL